MEMKKEKLVYKTEEQTEIFKFFMILFVVVGLIVAVFFFSKFFIKEEVKDYQYTAGSISTDKAIVGTIFNQPEKTYYVLAYDSTGVHSKSYLTYSGYYKNSQENALMVYTLDLNNGMNKEYYVKENSNPKATSIKDLKMLDGTLLKIQNGKIVKYLEGLDAVKNELKVTKEKK